MQVYSQLPLQKLSGYNYDVEDFEPYPCFPVPDAAGRAKRSVYFGPPSQKNDVYSIFKVENWLFWSAIKEKATGDYLLISVSLGKLSFKGIVLERGSNW